MKFSCLINPVMKAVRFRLLVANPKLEQKVDRNIRKLIKSQVSETQK